MPAPPARRCRRLPEPPAHPASSAPEPARRRRHRRAGLRPPPPELALQDGKAALARRDYPAPEATAREVLASNRTSPRAYDAQFLLAQALAGQRNYAGGGRL